MAKPAKVDLPTLAAKLTAMAAGSAAESLGRFVAHTWRKRVRRTFARELADVLRGVKHDPRAQADAAAATIEASAEGLEVWAFLRGFEAGRKAGADEAFEIAAKGETSRHYQALERQHNDAAVNRAEWHRRHFAAAAGLPETASWEQLREVVESLKTAARVLGHWRVGGAT